MKHWLGPNMDSAFNIQMFKFASRLLVGANSSAHLPGVQLGSINSSGKGSGFLVQDGWGKEEVGLVHPP